MKAARTSLAGRRLVVETARPPGAGRIGGVRRGRTITLVVMVMCAPSCGAPSSWRGLSPDHRRTFTVYEEDGRSCLALGTDEPNCFDGVALSRVVFSPDSRHMAYPVRDGERWRVVRDGRLSPPVDGVGEVVFGPDSRRLAYTAQRAGAWHVVVDGVFGAAFDSLYAESLTFDPTGRRIAFVAARDGGAVAVVDGTPGRPHAGVAQLRFSSDGSTVGYLARDESGARLYVNGTPGAAHEVIEAYAFAPHTDAIAYAYRQARESWVAHGSERHGPYLRVRALSFHPTDGALVFAATDAGGERVVVDGRPGPAYEAVDAPVFSAGGETWGYVAHDSIRSVVTMQGRVVDERAWIGNLAFDDDGSRYAYLTRGAEADFVVHDQGVQPFDMVVDGTLQFLEGTARWACLAGNLRNRRLFVAAEGVAARRDFRWADFAGVADRGMGLEAIESAALGALRAWVRAEAALMLEEAGG